MAGGGLSRYALQFRLLCAELGSLPLLAIAIVALAIGGHLVLRPVLQESLEQNRRALAAIRAAPIESDERHQMTIRHGEFRSRLAFMDERGNLLKALFNEAAEVGVMLSQGDYHLQDDADCNCRQLQVTLPVRGTYPQIRAFIDAVLEKMPALALDEISFRRDSVKAHVVEARLRVSLFLKDGD